MQPTWQPCFQVEDATAHWNLVSTRQNCGEHGWVGDELNQVYGILEEGSVLFSFNHGWASGEGSNTG